MTAAPAPSSRLQAEADQLAEQARAEQLRRTVATGEHAAPLELPMPTPNPWAAGLLAEARALGDIPDYGSPAWEALPDGDPRKVAAAVAAAELVRYEEATREARLRLELHALRLQWLAEEEAGYAAIADALPASVFRPAPAPFADPTPVVQTADWPTVAVPPDQRPQGLPSTAAMIRRVS